MDPRSVQELSVCSHCSFTLGTFRLAVPSQENLLTFVFLPLSFLCSPGCTVAFLYCQPTRLLLLFCSRSLFAAVVELPLSAPSLLPPSLLYPTIATTPSALSAAS